MDLGGPERAPLGDGGREVEAVLWVGLGGSRAVRHGRQSVTA